MARSSKRPKTRGGRLARVTAIGRRAVFRRAREQGGAWTGVAAAVFGARLVAKWAKRDEEIVHRQTLGPGEGVVITHLTETRADERAAAQATKKAAKQAAKAAKKRRSLQ